MVSIPASYWDCWDTLQHHLTLTKEMDGWMAPEDFTMKNYDKEDDRTVANASDKIRFY